MMKNRSQMDTMENFQLSCGVVVRDFQIFVVAAGTHVQDGFVVEDARHAGGETAEDGLGVVDDGGFAVGNVGCNDLHYKEIRGFAIVDSFQPYLSPPAM